MPTYDYKCDTNPEHKLTEIRGITETSTKTTCAEDGCDGKLLRVFSAPPITFKGSGFQHINK
jgi:putative FmdB family regulatory protein